MDLLEVAAYVILALLVIQFLRLILADGDLALMWAEKFGKGPGENAVSLILYFGKVKVKINSNLNQSIGPGS